MNPQSLVNKLRGPLLVALWVGIGPVAHAQDAKPFSRLAGKWSGSGTIDLVNGTKESIRCRASYTENDPKTNLDLNIRCASDSYNFELRGNVIYAAGEISGSWGEMSTGASGTLTGRSDGDRFQVSAQGQAFSAALNLVTRGNRQTVVIKSQDPKTTMQGVSITLQRS